MIGMIQQAGKFVKFHYVNFQNSVSKNSDKTAAKMQMRCTAIAFTTHHSIIYSCVESDFTLFQKQ